LLRSKKILISVGVVVILFMLFLGLILPEIIRRQAIAWVAENTERELTIERASFNPLIGRLTIRRVVLTEPKAEETFVSFDQLLVNINISSVWQMAPIIDQLELINPAVRIVKISDREFNFSDFAAGASPTEEAPSDSEPLRFAVNNLIIKGGTLDYSDLATPEIVHTIRNFDLALPFIGNTPALTDKFVQPRLSLEIDDAPFLIEGEAKPFADTLEASLQIRLDDIDLPFYAAYLPPTRPVDIENGKLAVDLDLSYKVTRDQETKLLLGGSFSITNLLVNDRRGEKVLFLPLGEVEIEWADLLARRGAIDQIAVYGMETYVQRDADGIVNLSRLAADSTPQDTALDEAGDNAPESADERSHVELRELRFRNGVIHFRDETGRKPFVREVRNLDIGLHDLDTLTGTPVPYNVKMNMVNPLSDVIGSLSAEGELTTEPLEVSAAIVGDKIDLGGIESYFPDNFSGLVTSGNIDSELRFDFTSTTGEISLSGTTGLRSLQLVEPVGRTDVLRWESLQLDGLDVQLDDGPPTISIAELTLNNYLAKLLVTKEGKVNIQSMMAEAPTEEDSDPPEIPEEPSGPAPVINIDRVTLQGGTFEFADQHMPKEFKTRMLNLGGRISGIDSASAQPASVDLRGNLENRSPLQIKGKLAPLGERLFADLNVRFDAIDLTPMTPYSGNYLGYAIEKGKLFLALDYKIDGEKLNASNNLFLDQFTFGQQVESEEATGLPVKLAVALLKDGQGEIHLDLPVAGSLDDPEFSVVGVVFTILKNLLVKAATSPFKLLGAMLGGGEDFSKVDFAAGDSQLPEAEVGKLDRLVDALRQRPNLKVEVSGYVDPEKDPEAWRRVHLTSEMKKLKAASMGRNGKDLDAISLSDEERSRYLKQIYRKADFPKPRNTLGFVKSLPDVEMEKLLLANTVAGEDEMQELATARAAVVHDYLIQVGELPSERVFLKKDDIYKEPDEDSANRSRVGFGATVD